MNTKITVFFLILFLVSCARGPIKNQEQSLRPVGAMPSLADDLDFAGLTASLEEHIRTFKTKPESEYVLGPRRMNRSEYIKALEFLLNEAKQDPQGERFRQALRANFEAYEVYGQDKWGEVLITSYFEPVMEGSKKQTAKFSQPLYGPPKDMVIVDVDSFRAARGDNTWPQSLPGNVWRGRLIPASKDRSPMVIAYPDRAQIDNNGLNKHAKVLAWVDPIDAFFLEIQGSGVVRFPDGKELIVGYASQNGHSYAAVGKYLFDTIPREKMSQQAIEAHLRSLPLPEARKVMQLNPSYVFFRPLDKRGITAFGNEVVPGRTIATDTSYFPKGTLAFLEFEKPVFSTPGDVAPATWQPTSRFVLDQDTGGAIRGPHRVDLFWGRGTDAKQAAGVMKNKGRLVYFIPKAEFLGQLK